MVTRTVNIKPLFPVSKETQVSMDPQGGTGTSASTEMPRENTATPVGPDSHRQRPAMTGVSNANNSVGKVKAGAAKRAP